MEYLRYITNNLFSDLEAVMIGVGEVSGKRKPPGEKADVGSVVEELNTFGKECK